MKTIHIDRENISSEEIQRFKDFKALLGNVSQPTFPKKTFYRTIWFNTITTVTVISIALIFYFTTFFPKSAIKETEKPKNSAFINPPVKAWDLRFTQIPIRKLNDTTITLISGSSVKLPANSLIDERGNIINENIILKVREIPSPAEMFLTGIPMAYDSAGVKNIFESAGMIEIYAFNNNKPLKINPQKPIEITLISKDANPAFNLYFLDTTLRNWVYKGKDKLNIEQALSEKPKSHISNILVDSISEIELVQVILQKPEPPRAANPNKWHFTLDLIKGEFPELDIFSKTTFEIDDTFKPLNKKHTQAIWEDATIKKGNVPMTYFVTFKTTKDSCTYLARPVYSLKEYYVAKAAYDSSLVQYQNLLNKQKTVQAKLNKQSIKKDTTIYVENSQPAIVTNYKIMRSFEILQFGIWNCDKPRFVKNERKIDPTYSIKDTLYRQTVYLADDKTNSIAIIYSNATLSFDRKANNTLWMVTYDNKIAVFSSSDFQSIPENVYRYTLNMRLIKKPIETSEDFIKLYQKGFKE